MVREAWKATYSPWDCKESDTTEQLTLSLWASLVAQMVKSLPAVQETWVQSPGSGRSPGEENAAHSNILAWRISRPGGSSSSLVGLGSTSPWGRKELAMTEPLTHTHHRCDSVGRIKKGVEGERVALKERRPRLDYRQKSSARVEGVATVHLLRGESRVEGSPVAKW